ncbi:MAG TPA: family 78 glycoside hydrolase catalytic domain [Puia sp.]|nr:family 78 glycoside hydrolase catalytic domain [Puia sp.]
MMSDRTPIIVVFDAGRTNKKMLLFDESWRLIHEKSRHLRDITDADGFPCENIFALTDWVKDGFEQLLRDRNYEIKAVNFSAYGSALVYLDGNQRVIPPIYNYLKPYPNWLKEKFLRDHGGEECLSVHAQAPIEGNLNAGLQLYRIKYEQPEKYKRIKCVLSLPQYLSFVLTGKLYGEITSLGCHSLLWDFEKSGYANWVVAEGFDKKLPSILPAGRFFNSLNCSAARNIQTGVGIHDSSASVIPYMRSTDEPFVLVSTGTWCVSMNPFDQLPLTGEDIQKGCMAYLSHEGVPIKASRVFAGRSHGHYLQDEKAMLDLIKSVRRGVDLVVDDSTKNIFVTGGFAKNDIFMRLLKNAFPRVNVMASRMIEASALGAAMILRFCFAFLLALFFIAPNSLFAQDDTIWLAGKGQRPYMTVFQPEASIRTDIVVIVCSGGSYRGTADEVEGIPAARKLQAAGITAFLLDYRLPQGNDTLPLSDAQNAIMYLRQWHFGSLGIMGFSAGGHLVSTIGTHFQHNYTGKKTSRSLRPDFMVLVYPVISFADSLTHQLSRSNFLGENITPERIREFSNELQVTEKTPPTFLVAAEDDNVVRVENSLDFAAACKQHGVPVTIFLYAKGGHGFGVNNELDPRPWTDSCTSWIKSGRLRDWKRNSPTAFGAASWISSPRFDSSGVCPVFRRQFSLDKPVKSATLSITAHGLYEASINGRRVGNAYFTPGWTDYSKRLQYQQYDIKSLLLKKNELRVLLGEGWYRGAFGHDQKRNRYGSDASILVALRIEFSDGSIENINSDGSWACGLSNILYSDIYNGETQDLRIHDHDLKPVLLADFRRDPSFLVPTISEPVTKQEEFRPKRIFRDSAGETIVDFGQNLAGWIRIRVHGNPGLHISIWHAETLDKHGNFWVGNLRQAKAEDQYILSGIGLDSEEPHFTYHGFRYIKVQGFVPTFTNCVAVAVHSNLKQTGTFSCSDTLINQLQHNIEWSLNSNFFDIPTDCPQRSERLGWCGDAQIFCGTAAFNRDVRNFFEKWLADLRLDQGKDGGVPVMIPDLYHFRNTNKGDIAGWSDAATIVPWTLYQIYVDTNILRESYASMKAWVNCVLKQSPGFLWTADGYGDWYAPGPSTDSAYIDECFWAHSTEILTETAHILGNHDDVAIYSSLLEKIKKAFLKKYWLNRNDTISLLVEPTQTAYVLALQFDMLPDSMRQGIADKLAAMIKKNNDHLATGFLGTPYLLFVLSRYGYNDLAYALLMQKTVPSWLYPISKGATTIWEKWDAIMPNDSIQAMSLNHYAYGAVGQWIYEVVGGISALEPGYRKIRIAPVVGGGLSWVKASYDCSFGTIVSEWKVKGKQIFMHVVVPAYTTAEVYIPGKGRQDAGPGSYHFIGEIGK